MMHFNLCWAVLALSSTTFALPASGTSSSQEFSLKSVREKLASPPRGWVKDGSAKFDKDSSMMSLRIHLVHQNMDKFHDLATKIATPGHELYGQHLSQIAIDNIIAPKDESRELLMQWLNKEGLGEHVSNSPRSDSIIVHASINQIEKLLDAEYEPFVHTESGDGVVRTLQYSIPDVLRDFVDLVQPTTFFGLRAMKSTISGHRAFDDSILETEAVQAVTNCTGTSINPKCLSSLYSYGTATNYKNGLMSIAGFLEEYPIKADLTTFMNKYATQGNAALSFTCTTVNGGKCPTSPAGIEANLDVQYARAITESIPNVYYSVGGRPPWLGSGSNTNEPYLEFLNYMLALPAASLPQTLSISYGDDESTVPLDYATNVCNLFSQLGARGVSILVASGDSGVGSTCSNKMYQTSFPAACPWVTTVGGTTGNSPESAWSGSGGGFSEVFGRPSYQTAAVNAWLAKDTSSHTVFNTSGRAYPDISAQATNFVIVASGATQAVDGTSCATPTFAGIIQLLNSDRLLAGKSPLGFLNPWLYGSATSGLTDITKGKNTGCSGVISGAGFSAIAGWDPATGLGTPIYTSLLAISKAT